MSALVERLLDQDRMVVYLAAEGLARVEPIEAALLPQLRDAMMKGDMNSRIHLSAVLGQVGPAALPYIFPMTKQKDWQLRYFSTFALAKAAPQSPEVLQVLDGLLEDTDLRVRAGAEGSLQNIRSPESTRILKAHGIEFTPK